MKNIKLLIVILIVAFSAFNISMSITENSENNITLNSINEHAFASSENDNSFWQMIISALILIATIIARRKKD